MSTGLAVAETFPLRLTKHKLAARSVSLLLNSLIDSL